MFMTSSGPEVLKSCVVRRGPGWDSKGMLVTEPRFIFTFEVFVSARYKMSNIVAQIRV